MTTFYCKLTDVGRAKVADAIANGTQVNLTEMAVGDANVAHYDPDGTETALRNERYRSVIEQSRVEHQHQVMTQMTIPVNQGGFFIREAGLFDGEGDLITIAKLPEGYKPTQVEGAPEELTVRFYQAVESADNVTILIDPSLVYVTLDYFNQHAARADNVFGPVTSLGNIANTSLAPGESAMTALPLDSYMLGFESGPLSGSGKNCTIEFYSESNSKVETVKVLTEGNHQFLVPPNARSVKFINTGASTYWYNVYPCFKMKNYWSVS